MQIVVRQFSGLGNQLFQYAAGLYYSKRCGGTLRLSLDPARNAVSYGYPRPFLLSNFSIHAPAKPLSVPDRVMLADKPWLTPITGAMQNALGVQVIREEHGQRYKFVRDLPLRTDIRTLYLVGYWQAYGLADAVADELRAELRFKDPASGKNLEVLNQIKRAENSVSLHVRRGDYTLVAEGNRALPIKYYSDAIRLIEGRLDNPTFFVFSDDIAYARENLPLEGRAVFVDHNDDASAHEDLRLMSSCHHHIIANSSFSWWGAWLNSRADKLVLAPRYWYLSPDSYYPDLLPPGWILTDV